MTPPRERLDSGKNYSDLLRGLARGPTAPPRRQGEAVRVVSLPPRPMTLGSDPMCDIELPSDLIARRHATVEPWPEGYAVHDAGSPTGTYVNGRGVVWAPLQVGDLLQLGPYLFHVQPDNHLLWLKQSAALTLAGIGIKYAIGPHTLVDDVSLVARPGEFIGLLGPSGAGKTTLLNILSGLLPAGQGRVLINGEPIAADPERWRTLIGYVPQEDIVHRELTARQAFRFAARLRLPVSATPNEREAMVERTLDLLDLTKRADVVIALLSGGQRKRVSVGVELLGRPRLLFLDEPTSGLDPSTESKLMATLRDLAHQGRTVVCTTHIMENIDLFDRAAVLAPGGKLAYFGPPDEMLGYFDVDRFSRIYDRLDETDPERSRVAFQNSPLAWKLKEDVAIERNPRPFHEQDRPEPSPRLGLTGQWLLMTRRFAWTLFADRKTRWLLLAQPLVVGGLIGMVFDDVRVLTFLLVIATLWFGCGLAAQQIVKERPVLRRERRVALDWGPYVVSKFTLLGLLTFLQGAAMFYLVHRWRGLPGKVEWQMIALALAALNGVAFGLVISSLSATADSAAAAVPLTLIPQIVLAGFLLPLPDMNRPTRGLANFIPARWSYHLMDAAWLDGRAIDAELLNGPKSSWAMLNLYPDANLKDAEARGTFLEDHRRQSVELQRDAYRSMAAAMALFLVQFLVLMAIGARRE